VIKFKEDAGKKKTVQPLERTVFIKRHKRGRVKKGAIKKTHEGVGKKERKGVLLEGS